MKYFNVSITVDYFAPEITQFSKLCFMYEQIGIENLMGSFRAFPCNSNYMQKKSRIELSDFIITGDLQL
jgi:hypothetical protein